MKPLYPTKPKEKIVIKYADELGSYKLYYRPVPKKSYYFGGITCAPGQGMDGYGEKITSDIMLKFDEGILSRYHYRVYAICFSNAASHYIVVNKTQRYYLKTHFWDEVLERDAQ